ncbi:MAG: ThuA domain-containing protein [Verrucomicrobiota bacterium]
MPEGFDKTLTRDQLRDLMTFLLTQPLTPVAPEINGQPAPRTRAEVDLALKGVQPVATDTTGRSQPFSIVLCAGPKDHGPGEHDYPLWQKRWAKLLSLADGVAVTTAWEWPSSDQWKAAQTVVFYSNLPGWNTARATELKAFLDRGGGAVFLHYAVDGHTNVQELADVIGLAWKGGTSKFRHGPLDLKLSPGPFSSGLSSLRLVDESYWNLIGTMRQAELVATGVEEGEAQPLIWNLSHGEGRVFVSIPGHYSWSFDDPLFRLLLLRGICWTGHQPLDRLVELISIGCPLPAD